MCRDSAGKIEFHQEGGLLHRSYTEKIGHVVRRPVVPRCHREAILKTAHDEIMAGHLGTQKAKDRILEEFFWPGITADVKRFVASCDICQRIIPKGRVTPVPLGKAPLIETPFKRVVIDRHCGPNPFQVQKPVYPDPNGLRNPEAVALPSVKMERVDLASLTKS